jgi:hypothetical protein
MQHDQKYFTQKPVVQIWAVTVLILMLGAATMHIVGKVQSGLEIRTSDFQVQVK